MSTYRDRRLARADRLRDWAAKRAARAGGRFSRAHAILQGIPVGQPILVGHHSERRHRRDLARVDAAMRGGIEDTRAADAMTSRADNIEDAADRAIYRDDPDAIERLQAKIAALESRRETWKAANKIIRKRGQAADVKIAALGAIGIGPALARELLTPDCMGELGYPSYKFQNIGGTITKERKRLAELTAAKTSAGSAIVAPGADTPIARAGLRIVESMTTPRKAWKKPRPVWNVVGNLAYWRPILVEQLGGTLYGGAVSFFDDPTDAIAREVLDVEQPADAAPMSQPATVTVICGHCEREWSADATDSRVCPACGNDGDIEWHAVRVEPIDSPEFAAHRAADPHCTCNDCIVYHESMLS